MVDVILGKLKTAYSALGLGDNLLTALAQSLNSTGLVTADNVDGVVSAQREGLEAIQKANDRRVGEALEKARKESERQASAAADASKAELERLRAQVAELSKPREQAQPNAEPSSPEPSQESSRDWFKAEREALLAEMERRLSAVADGNKALTETVKALQQENDAMKAAQAIKERAAFIDGKAKELGIPEWRVQEGFGLSGDATEEDVTRHLTQVAEHIRAQTLPSGGVRLALGTDGKPDKEQIKGIAERLVARS